MNSTTNVTPKKKHIAFLASILFAITALLYSMMLTGCGAQESYSQSSISTNPHMPGKSDNTLENTTYTFVDAIGREVTVTSADRVGIASGSFAECWILAGGTPTAVTQDVLNERDLNLPDNTIDMGSLVHPSIEVIMDSDLDFVILVSTVKTHLEMGKTLDKAGIPYAYMNIETFEDYLNTLKVFTDLTGRPDLYEKNGLAIAEQIDDVIANTKLETAPKVLVLRSSSSKITARNSETMVGQMLKNLGCTNIADQEGSLLDDLSLEVIAQENPEYIFVICRGDEAEAKANLENMLASNQIWKTLDAVKNNHVYYLEKELFHYKPTVRWGESYEVLAEIFAEN